MSCGWGKLRAALLLVGWPLVRSLDNGLARTPQMGYNTWNDFRCEGLSAAAVKEIADRIVDLGLDKLGYKYLNIDDCWSRELSQDGLLIEDPVAFPDGMKAIVDYVHGRGLLFGIYTCRGTRTCAFRPGSKDLEHHHASQFAAWGIDYIKEDSCFASNKHQQAFGEYGTMRDALNETGRPIFFSLCGWNAWYAPQGARLANSWRIAPDCDEWANVYVAIRTNEPLAAFAGPGGWNDPDMLVGSNPAAAVSFSPQQVQTQFSMWAVMASPLLIGSCVLKMPASDLATYSNEEVIRINQDPLGVQGTAVWSNCPLFSPRDNWWMAPWTMPQDVAVWWTAGLVIILLSLAAWLLAIVRSFRALRPARGSASQPILPPSGVPVDAAGPVATIVVNEGRPRERTAVGFSSRICLATMLVPIAALGIPSLVMLVAIYAMKPHVDACQQVWARPLEGGATALCLVNFASEPTRVTCDADCMQRIGYPNGVHVRDVVAGRDLGPFDVIELDIPGDGGSTLLRLVAKGGI